MLFIKSSKCKIASAARNGINSSPQKQQRRPLPSPLYVSYFYDYIVKLLKRKNRAHLYFFIYLAPCSIKIKFALIHWLTEWLSKHFRLDEDLKGVGVKYNTLKHCHFFSSFRGPLKSSWSRFELRSFWLNFQRSPSRSKLWYCLKFGQFLALFIYYALGQLHTTKQLSRQWALEVIK